MSSLGIHQAAHEALGLYELARTRKHSRFPVESSLANVESPSSKDLEEAYMEACSYYKLYHGVNILETLTNILKNA